MGPYGVEVVAGQLALRQCLERRGEVVRALEAQQGLFEIAPTADLWWGTETGEQIKAQVVQMQSTGQSQRRFTRDPGAAVTLRNSTKVAECESKVQQRAVEQSQ